MCLNSNFRNHQLPGPVAIGFWDNTRRAKAKQLDEGIGDTLVSDGRLTATTQIACSNSDSSGSTRITCQSQVHPQWDPIPSSAPTKARTEPLEKR